MSSHPARPRTRTPYRTQFLGGGIDGRRPLALYTMTTAWTPAQFQPHEPRMLERRRPDSLLRGIWLAVKDFFLCQRTTEECTPIDNRHWTEL